MQKKTRFGEMKCPECKDGTLWPMDEYETIVKCDKCGLECFNNNY